jgi:hypothetical protein
MTTHALIALLGDLPSVAFFAIHKRGSGRTVD